MKTFSVQSPKHLGESVRATRKKLGLTQPELALASGVGVRFIVDLEAGKPTVRLESVLRVLDGLGGTLHLSGMINSADEDDNKVDRHAPT